MIDTYCGNSCEACELRQQLSCRGCRLGPGRPFSGWCEIAACCRDKDHNSCESCTKKDYGCSKYANHKNAPQRWVQKYKADAARKRTLDRTAPILAKRLWLLFWLLVPYIIFQIFSIESLAQRILLSRWIGLGIRGLYLIFLSVTFFSLTTINKGYRNAGICTMFAIGILIGHQFVPIEKETMWNILLDIPDTILGFCVRHAEWTAHSDELLGLDDQLAEKWKTLWTHYLYSLLGVIGVTVLTLIIPALGIIALVVVLIAVAVIEIKVWVYRYLTACSFREYIS